MQQDDKVYVTGYFVVTECLAMEVAQVAAVRFFIEGKTGEPVVLRQGIAWVMLVPRYALHSASFRLSRKEMTTDGGEKVAALSIMEVSPVSAEQAELFCRNCDRLREFLTAPPDRD